MSRVPRPMSALSCLRLRLRLGFRLLLRATLRRDLVHVFRGVAHGFLGVQPAILELGLGVRVAVRLIRCALTPLAGAHLLALPARVGGGIAILEPADVLAELLFLVV